MPIISSTATTLAAFFPLVFWDSIMGEFMSYLPITLIIVLASSLFVALVIIPVVFTVFYNYNSIHNVYQMGEVHALSWIVFAMSGSLQVSGRSAGGTPRH